MGRSSHPLGVSCAGIPGARWCHCAGGCQVGGARGHHSDLSRARRRSFYAEQAKGHAPPHVISIRIGGRREGPAGRWRGPQCDRPGAGDATLSCGQPRLSGCGQGAARTRRGSDNRKAHTPLHRAAIRGKAAIVPILLKHGASTEARDKEGRTPIEYARNKEIRRHLGERRA